MDDGKCNRDYVHVTYLAHGHVNALIEYKNKCLDY